MSDEDFSVRVTCYYGGKFETVDGEYNESYVGGGIRLIDIKPNELFQELMNQLPMSLYGQKVWYNLPFEGLEERKLLTNGDVNFKRMCEASVWTKSINVFVEAAELVEDETETNHQELDGVDERNDIQFEERVEMNAADFVDEEIDEYATPVGSDDEEAKESIPGYVRYEKGSGELKLSQTFDSLEDFKQAMVDYVLKEGWNVKYVCWEKDKSELKCASVAKEGEEKCMWKIYCAYEKPLQKWWVKTFFKTHSCQKTGYSKLLNQEVIAKLFVNVLRDNPAVRPKDIQEDIQTRWELIASIDQCRKAKTRALEMIQEEHALQFSRLRDYRLELLDSNENSTVELETFQGGDGLDVFYRFYVCFAALKQTWCSYCRPIFGLDGCFLKCTTKGQLLAAVGRDANNQMFPIAWAVVDVENEDNWRWFIKHLQTDLKLRDGDGFTVISDRQKGLLNAVSSLLPKIEHRMCARHIYANLKKNHPHRADMKGLFWKVAKSYNKAQYEKRIDEVKAYDMSVYDSMMQKNPMNCSLAFFSTDSSCDAVSNNISESFNHAIDPARAMPLFEMFETIRRRAMLRIEARLAKAMKHRGKFSLQAVKIVAGEQKKIKHCIVYGSGHGVYEVKEKNSAFKVYMETRSCTCRRWDMTGLPCRHALKIISARKLNKEDYMSDWYLTSRWRNEYSMPILPVRGVNFWEKTDEVIVPPPTTEETRKGRKKIQKRIRERNESPNKKKTKERQESPTKVSRERRIVHCGNCGDIGHNTRKCQKLGAHVYRRPKKKTTTEDGYGDVEGLSQPMQSQGFRNER